MTYNDYHACEVGDDLETTALRKSDADEEFIATSKTARSGADTARHFLDDLLADLPDDAVVGLVIEQPLSGEPAAERVWEGTVERLFGGDLDTILESLMPGGRLYVFNRSGDRVFAVAAQGSVANASYVLSLDGREVSVAVLEPPVVDDRFADIEIPVPGVGRVTIAAGEGEPVALDHVFDLYPDALRDEEDVAPPSGAQEWFDGTFEGSVSPEIMAREIIVGQHTTAKKDYGWSNLEGTLGQIAEMFMRHPVMPSKDGPCILGGQLIGDRRKKDAVRAMYFAILDLDSGEDLPEIQTAIRGLDRHAYVYSSFSHLATQDDLARKDLLDYQKKAGGDGEIDDALLRRYLNDVKRKRQYIVDNAAIIDDAAHNEQGIRVVYSHAPLPKWRIVFPLHEPLVFVKRCNGDQRLAQADWAGRLYGLAARLGVQLDKACTDPSRLWYTPRHAEGRSYVCWAYFSNNLLNIDEDVGCLDPRCPSDVFSAFGGRTGGESGKLKNGWLVDWKRRYALKSELDRLIEDHTDLVVGPRVSGDGFTIICPNREEHSTDKEGGTFVAPADPDSERPCIIKCTHDHCAEIDTLMFLDMLIEAGKLPKEKVGHPLFDPAYLMLEGDEPEPAEWRSSGTSPEEALEAAESACHDYETGAKETTFDGCLRRLAYIWGDLEPDSRAKIVKRIAKKSELTATKVEKRLAMSMRDEGVDLGGEHDAGDFRAALGADYAVLHVDGKVGVINLTKSSDTSKGVSPSIMGRRDFELLVANRTMVITNQNGDPETVPASKAFFEWPGRPTFDGLYFEPNEAACPKDGFNAWRGFSFAGKHRGRGAWDLLRAHILDNLCAGNEKHDEWLMAWTASIFQRPHLKPGSGIVFRGKKGVGKSYFADDTLARLLKPYSRVVSDQKSVTGDFTDHLFGKLLIVLDEAFFGGDKRHEGKLKAMITGRTMEFNKKFVSATEVSNHARLIFTSNEGWTIPSSFDRERRYLMLDVADSRQDDVAYFSAIEKQMKVEGGDQAFVYDMLNWPKPEGGWNILRVPPQTKALNEQKVRSLTPGQRFFIEIIENGEADILVPDPNGGPGEYDMVKLVQEGGDGANRVYGKALRQAYYDYVKKAGHHRDAEPSAFARYAEEILLAENGGRPKGARKVLGAPTTSAEHAASHMGYERDDDRTYKAIVFPALRDIVDAHARGGRFEFDLNWGI